MKRVLLCAGLALTLMSVTSLLAQGPGGSPSGRPLTFIGWDVYQEPTPANGNQEIRYPIGKRSTDPLAPQDKFTIRARGVVTQNFNGWQKIEGFLEVTEVLPKTPQNPNPSAPKQWFAIDALPNTPAPVFFSCVPVNGPSDVLIFDWNKSYTVRLVVDAKSTDGKTILTKADTGSQPTTVNKVP